MFNVGDKVVVVRRSQDYTNGWYNSWYAGGMDPYILNGQVYTISSIRDGNIRFKEDQGIYGWPAQSLAFAEGYEGVSPVVAKIRQMEEKRKSLGYRW